MTSEAKPLSEHFGPDRRTVFVVHGRNEQARSEMFAFLRSLGLHPIEWSEAIAMTKKASPYIGEILDVAFGAAQAVVVLFTPDEIAYLRPEYGNREDDPETTPATQARPNVLFEAGIATGRNPDRTVLVELGSVRAFSDTAGKHVVRLDDSPERRKDLAQRLRSAGCEVNLDGEDWLRAGTFTVPTPPGGTLPLGRRVPPTQGRRARVDIRIHERQHGDRLEIVNTGPETIFDLDLALPEEAGALSIVDRNELPLKRLPPGKSAFLLAIRGMGHGGKDHFDVRVTGRLSDGQEFSEDVFVSMLG